MRSLDPGTMWFCKGEIETIGDDDEASFLVERNVFAEVRQNLEDPETVLRDNHYAYLKYKNRYYVVGEDVFKVHEIESLFKKSGASSYFSEVRRPMKDGLINTAEDKMSIAIIQEIIRKLVGRPKYEGEVLCFCVPGSPVNRDSNVLFHQTILSNFIRSLGYTPECINEALAVIYSECPTADDPNEPGGIAKFSGLAFSIGAGLINCCLAWKQLPLLSFSVAESGDWLDQEAAKIVGCDTATITKYKEKYLNLAKINESNLKDATLNIYYGAMIENTMKHFASKFEKLDEKTDIPLEIVVAGGTASVPGFIEKFKKVLTIMELPFDVKDVKLAKNPLFTVCNGCLIKAISVERKLKKQSSKSKKQTPDSAESQTNKEKPVPKMKLKK